MNILFIGNGFDLAHNVKISFHDFVKSEEFKKHMKTHYKFFTKKSEKIYFKYFQNTELWSHFEEYCFRVTDEIETKKGLFYKKISKAFSEWLRSEWLRLKKKRTLEKIEKMTKFLKENKIDTIISFNFTDTPSIYGFKKKTFSYESYMKEWINIEDWKNHYVLIHFFPTKKKTEIGECVIGHDLEKRFNKNWEIRQWGEEKGKINHKNKLIKTITKAINNNKIEKIFFYGFNFGESDQNIRKFLDDNKDFDFYIHKYKNEIPENVKELKNIIPFQL